MNHYETFQQLHQHTSPLLIGNIWDAHSARVFGQQGFRALATSSAAVANSFGYEDGEKLPFELLVQLAKKVISEVKIPVSVDMEGGYSRTAVGISENIKKLYDVGVVGINLEDTVSGGTRSLHPVSEFQKLLEGIQNQLQKYSIKMFLNIRTDGFLLGMPTALDETLMRIKAYEKTGINGVFVPCVEAKEDIKKLAQSTALPINVMCMPKLPSFKELAELGVKRISMGNFVHQFVAKSLENKLQEINKDESFKSLFA
jgi:2-methylisocitrate lyase-like PEP mutase family enzyme